MFFAVDFFATPLGFEACKGAALVSGPGIRTPMSSANFQPSGNFCQMVAKYPWASVLAASLVGLHSQDPVEKPRSPLLDIPTNRGRQKSKLLLGLLSAQDFFPFVGPFLSNSTVLSVR